MAEPVFKLGFNKSDAVRSAWSFVLPFVAVFAVSALGILNTLVSSCNDQCDWNGAKTAGIAAVIALASAILVGIKNFLLANGTTLKG
jgi:predicted ATP-grasp superfamily ATP-dependent carboligase